MSPSIEVWEGVYESYAAAAADAVGPGFAGDTWRERSTRAARECLEALENGRPIPTFHKQRSVHLPFVVAAAPRGDEGKVRVLDFGGGLGIGYMTLAESTPDHRTSVEYSIVEIAPVCAAGRALHGSAVRYLEALPEPGTVDVLHASSSVQYVDDWKGLLRALAGLRAPLILLSDVFAGAIPSFVTLQNYYGSRIPHWFFAMDELMDIMIAGGYHLAAKVPVQARRLDVDDTLPMDRFPTSHRLDRSLHLLFRREVRR